MSKTAKTKILCVDDESNVLDAFKRHLRRKFDVHTASSGAEGLEVLAKHGTFAVVVSDLRMPGMSGIEFLAAVCQEAEDTSRILLTGDADLTAAMAAVNEGNIFRFLSKPCPPVELIPAIEAGARQHELVTSERVLLEKTLYGSIKMLTEVLALANPTAFGRATRIQQKVGELARRLDLQERWKIEMAAMLSQVACITLPPETLEKVCAGQELSAQDQKMVAGLPEIAVNLLQDIPRIEDVKEILSHLKGKIHDRMPTGALVLRVVLDLDVLEAQGHKWAAAIERVRARDDGTLAMILGVASQGDLSSRGALMREVSICLAELQTGMMLIDSLMTVDGRLLVAHGNEVTKSLLLRLRNFADKHAIQEPFRVLAPQEEPVEVG